MYKKLKVWAKLKGKKDLESLTQNVYSNISNLVHVSMDVVLVFLGVFFNFLPFCAKLVKKVFCLKFFFSVFGRI